MLAGISMMIVIRIEIHTHDTTFQPRRAARTHVCIRGNEERSRTIIKESDQYILVWYHVWTKRRKNSCEERDKKTIGVPATGALIDNNYFLDYRVDHMRKISLLVYLFVAGQKTFSIHLTFRAGGWWNSDLIGTEVKRTYSPFSVFVLRNPKKQVPGFGRVFLSISHLFAQD